MKTCPNINCNKKRELKLKRKMKMKICEQEEEYEETYRSGNECDNLTKRTHRNGLSLDEDNCKGIFNTVTSLGGNSKKTKQFINGCPGDNKCKNYKQVIELQCQIQKLMRTINELTKLNEYLKFSLLQKDRMYKMLVNCDNIKNISQGKKYSHHKSVSSLIGQVNYDKNAKSEINKEFGITENTFRNSRHINKRSSIKHEEMCIQPHHKRSRNPYEKLMEMTTRSQKHDLQNSAGVSFLALPDERLRQLINNSSLNNLYRLTLSDSNFLQEFKQADNDSLLSYCYIINSITKDYQTTLHLIRRIKHYMECSVELANSIFHNNSIETIITSTNRILDCEETSIVIHDAFTDMFIEHTINNQKSIYTHTKENGIIRKVFTSGEKVKIDDTASDNRFKTYQHNNKIRNVICYPLIDYEGDIFGVIQSVNKRKECFDNNDEEIFGCYVQHISCILQQRMQIDLSKNQINKIKEIISYQIEISNRKCKVFNFVKSSEKILMNIFMSSSAQVLFVIDGILYNPKTEMIVDNVGIVNYVYVKKECHGCSNVKNCKYYNTLTDMDAVGSLVTFPIIEPKTEKVIAIIQTMFNAKLSDKNELPKQNEMMLFHLIEKCFINWMQHNKNEISCLIIN